MGSNISQKFYFVWITCETINLNVVSKTQSILCNWGNDVESVIHFFFHRSVYSNERCTLPNSLSKIDHKLLDSIDSSLSQTLLFGNSSFITNDDTNLIILPINFVLSTKRFDGPLLWTVIFFLSHSNNYKWTGIILYLLECKTSYI